MIILYVYLEELLLVVQKTGVHLEQSLYFQCSPSLASKSPFEYVFFEE